MVPVATRRRARDAARMTSGWNGTYFGLETVGSFRVVLGRGFLVSPLLLLLRLVDVDAW